MAGKRLRKAVRETVMDLVHSGAIDVKTMREFETLRLEEPRSLSAYDIRHLRLKEGASQAVFAAYLNTSVSTVQKWEVGKKSPSGPALKLLDLVQRKGLKALGTQPAKKPARKTARGWDEFFNARRAAAKGFLLEREDPPPQRRKNGL